MCAKAMESQLWLEKFVKYCAKNAAKCRTPEKNLLRKLSENFKKNHDDCTTISTTLYTYFNLKMNNIEEIAYLGTHQKVQMLFVMSKKVNEKFEEILLQQGFEFELDDQRKFKHVRSNDGKLQLNDACQNGISPPARSDDSSEQKPDELEAPEEQEKNEIKQKEPLVHILNPNEVKQEQLDAIDESEELEYEEQQAEKLREEHRRIVQENLKIIRREAEEERLERERVRREGWANEQIRALGEDSRLTNSKRRQSPMPTEAKRSRPNDEESSKSSSASFMSTPEPRAQSTVSLPRIPDDSTSHNPNRISALKVAQQFEVMIACCGLEDLEQMASQMVQSLSNNDKTIQSNVFHQIFYGMLAMTSDEKLATFQGDCMKLKVFCKSLKLSVIRPLGETVKKTLEFVEKMIKKLEDHNDESVVPMDTIRDNLKTFLLSINSN